VTDWYMIAIALVALASYLGWLLFDRYAL